MDTRRSVCYTVMRVMSILHRSDPVLTIGRQEVREMSRKCEVCGKGQVSGNKVSHSNRHSRRKWNANIQTIRINDNGTIRRANVCTKCMRAGKVNRAI